MMRNALPSFALFVMMLILSGCGDNVWDELPSPIASFVSEYFPFGEVDSFEESDRGFVVKIKKGVSLSFDRDCVWTDVDGRGSILPQNFLYDKLPPVLYDYIESIEHVNDVYRVRRVPNEIIVEFHDSKIVYDAATTTITYPDASPSAWLP